MTYIKCLHVFFSVWFIILLSIQPVTAQQVLEGEYPVAPAFMGQTRAPIAPKSAKFEVNEFVTGLYRPWAMAHLPNGNMIVTEVPGRMRIVTPDGLVSDPISGVPLVRPWVASGLNDIIIDPDFEDNRLIYFTYVAAPAGINTNNTDEDYENAINERQKWNSLTPEEKISNPWGITKVARAVLSADEKSITDVKVLIETQYSKLAFDDSGRLLITTSQHNPFAERDLKGTFGMVLRLNRDGTVPDDNPFIGNSDVNDMIFAFGLRNSSGFERNPESGEFWVADQSAVGGDEVNIIRAGKDYGWPYVSYGRLGDNKPIREGYAVKKGTEQPVYYWSPKSLAPSDMLFYTGDMFPEWKGSLFVTGLTSMDLTRLVLSGDHVVGEERFLDEPGHRLRDVSQGSDGAIYIIEDTPKARILKITAPDA